jgi:hypothetical protein
VGPENWPRTACPWLGWPIEQACPSAVQWCWWRGLRSPSLEPRYLWQERRYLWQERRYLWQEQRYLWQEQRYLWQEQRYRWQEQRYLWQEQRYLQWGRPLALSLQSVAPTWRKA